MGKKYILAIDQGTTSSRAILFDGEKNLVVGSKSKPLRQIYPKPGWVEHDPVQIRDDQINVILEVIKDSGISPKEIAALGITNQRETVVLWDRKTGLPVHNAIVWQCRRTASLCNRLKFDGYTDSIKMKTGLVADAYFSGTKIQWLLENVPGIREKADRGQIMAGTIDSWLIYNLTGKAEHLTDYTNASRTMIFNINTLEWDRDLLKAMDIPIHILPRLVSSSGYIAKTDKNILGFEIPICGIAGDQQAALFGQACFTPGTAKNTYGTGCFILMNIGDTPRPSENNLLNTIAWVIDGKTTYALEGSIFNTGSAIQWLRDEMGLIRSSPEADVEAEKVPDTNGVYMVPAFTGLGAPHWDMYARGTILGLTRGSNKNHLIRAVLESIAYQSTDVLNAMNQDSGIPLKELKADGGASVSDFLMQFQADIQDIRVIRPEITETTALGAIYLAGLGSGIWTSKEEIAENFKTDRVFTPSMSHEERNKKYSNWKKAVERSLKWDI